MGKLVIVAGNSGVGKTTLTRILGERLGFAAGFEDIPLRPFQELFKRQPDHAFINQVEFLVTRAEQERAVRQARSPGILDGGLEMDFHVFTRLFHHKGWLNVLEMSLLDRLYRHFRTFLPMPDVIIHMDANLETVKERYLQRSRSLEIVSLEDLAVIENILHEWLSRIDPGKVIHLDANPKDAGFSMVLSGLMDTLKAKLREQ